MSSIRTAVLALSLSLGSLFAASAASITVQATAEIWAAGGNSPLGEGATSPSIALPDGDDRIIRLEFVSGSVTWNGGYTDYNPDSRPLDPSHDGIFPSKNKISGIQGHRRWYPVYGVFLGSSLPSVAPAGLDYGSGPYTPTSASVAPLLGQLFLIGDGFTGLVDGSGYVTSFGDLQEFIIPEGATHLYLGFNDNLWSDNYGSYLFNYEITTAIPEPSTLSLLGALTLGAVFLRRRR